MRQGAEQVAIKQGDTGLVLDLPDGVERKLFPAWRCERLSHKSFLLVMLLLAVMMLSYFGLVSFKYEIVLGVRDAPFL